MREISKDMADKKRVREWLRSVIHDGGHDGRAEMLGIHPAFVEAIFGSSLHYEGGYQFYGVRIIPDRSVPRWRHCFHYHHPDPSR